MQKLPLLKFYVLGLKKNFREVDKNRKAGEKEVKRQKKKWGGLINKWVTAKYPVVLATQYLNTDRKTG